MLLKCWRGERRGWRAESPSASPTNTCLSLDFPAKYWGTALLAGYPAQRYKSYGSWALLNRPFPSISSLFWIMRASEQADTGFKGFVQAGQAGVYKREKISSVPLLFIASSQAVSLLPVTKLPAVTDEFSFGQWHVQQPTCLDKLGGLSVQLKKLAQRHAEQHCSARSVVWLGHRHACLVGLWKEVWACWGGEGKGMFCFLFA